MGSGYLEVFVTEAGGSAPVSGAVVTIKDAHGFTLRNLTTNATGKTGSVKLMDARFGVYTLEVRKNGFGVRVVKNVRASGAVAAVLPVELVPDEKIPAAGQSELSPIPPVERVSEGARVVELQKSLNKVSEKYGTLSVPEDGVFGHETRHAVRAAQRLLGLAVSGLADEETRAKIKAIADGIAELYPPVAPAERTLVNGFGHFANALVWGRLLGRR